MTRAIKLSMFLKPYQGTGKYEDEKLFYEENEWRYIPKTLSKGDKLSVPYFDDQIVTDAIKHKHEVENFIIDEPLKFEPEDIRYIFIDDDKERMNVIKMIKRIKSTKYPRDQIDILCSKIMSYNQLKKDV
ncbi:hypothetical protein FACS189442_1210 [Spirochaetia bacterium]|nr:hypothetical protein FACS189442_1210 [Spirochaetia bacterium]